MIIKISKFKAEHRKLHFSKRIVRKEKLSKLHFDRIIIGSDEVWNFQTDLIGYDPTYFSDYLNADRIISYAASFGTVKNHEEVPDELRKLLLKMNFLSVRDQNSANIIREICKKQINVVLDPSFLIDLKAEAITPKEQGFVLIYGAFTQKIINHIVEYARLIGKKTVSISYNNPWCDISLNTLSPFQ